MHSTSGSFATYCFSDTASHRRLALVNRLSRTLVGQGVAYGGSMFVPLHVVDDLPGLRALSATDCNDIKIDLGSATIRATVEKADCGIIDIDAAGHNADEKHFLREGPRYCDGAHVDVSWLEIDGNGAVSRTIRRTVHRQTSRVNRYSYRTAGDRYIQLNNVEVGFLAMPAKIGVSGAAVTMPETGCLVGFIHGNAELNNDCAIYLSLCPLVNIFNNHCARNASLPIESN